MQTILHTIGWVIVMSILSHSPGRVDANDLANERTFGEDVDFLASYVDAVVLGKDDAGPQLVVVPDYQGRVMTSSAAGQEGISYGWINYEQITKGIVDGAQINVFGGEERLWFGPEGGQYSIFFVPGAKFEFSQWQTPAVIDTQPFQVTAKDARLISLQHKSKLTNYSGTSFDLQIQRRIELLNTEEIVNLLGSDCAKVASVGYRTTNRLTNIGENNWSQQTGLLSIWILGMYKHGPQTTIVVPFRSVADGGSGPVMNDDYFGKVPENRIRIGDGVLFFLGDGKQRGKIGLSPQRATPICGSYDAARGVLTIVKYNQPGPEITQYVNSKWEIQKKPFAGDVINAYNDGAPEPGIKPLGPFYELETSSPALSLKAGETGEHIQETFHFEGEQQQLDRLSQSILGVTLEQIQTALPGVDSDQP